jgi:hypothetical protein
MAPVGKSDVKKLVGSAILLCGMLAQAKCAVADDAWLTGDQFRQALKQTAGATWRNIPLRRAVEVFSRSQKVAVLLDRRIDPEQNLELSVENAPLEEVFQRIASRVEIGSSILGPVVYLGPITAATRLRTVAAIAKQRTSAAPEATRKALAEMRPFKWDDLAAPRDLLQGLAQEGRMRIDNLEKVPADLWYRGDLPPLSLSDRLTLALVQFDLTFEIGEDGNSIRLVTMPERPVIEHRYSAIGSVEDAAARLQQNKLLAAAEIKVDGEKLLVIGRQEDQEVVSQLLAGSPVRQTKIIEGQKIYTLKLDEPVAISKLLKAIATQTGLEIQVDQQSVTSAGISLEKRVGIDVKKVSADELLKAVLEPAGLTFTRNENQVQVKAK